MASCNGSSVAHSSSDDTAQICRDYISEENVTEIIDVNKHCITGNNLISGSLSNGLNNISFDNSEIEQHQRQYNEVEFDSNSNPRLCGPKRKRSKSNNNLDYSPLEYSPIDEFKNNNDILHKKTPPPDHSKSAFLLSKKCYKDFRLVGYHVAEFQRRNDTGTPTLKLISPTIGAPGLVELEPNDMQKILDSLTEVSLSYSRTVLQQLKKILYIKKDKYLKAINILKNLNTSAEYTALRNKLIAQVNYELQKKCYPKPLYETSPTVKILVNGITHSINSNNLNDFKATITASYEEPIEVTLNSPETDDHLPSSQLPEEDEDIQPNLAPAVNHLSPNIEPDLGLALNNISIELKNLVHTVATLKKKPNLT